MTYADYNNARTALKNVKLFFSVFYWPYAETETQRKIHMRANQIKKDSKKIIKSYLRQGGK